MICTIHPLDVGMTEAYTVEARGDEGEANMSHRAPHHIFDNSGGGVTDK